MSAPQSIPAALLALYRQLSPARRRALVALMPLMLAGAVAEVATLGALLPFLAVMADPQGSPILASLAPLLDVFGANGAPGRAISLLAGLFALAALVAAGLPLTLLWVSNSSVNGMSSALAVKLYEQALNEPYVVHTRRNT